jgi:hypothetical protein
MVLKRCMKIGLGWVSGITGFGKKTQVGQLKVTYELCCRLERLVALFTLIGPPCKGNEQKYEDPGKIEEPECGFSHLLTQPP